MDLDSVTLSEISQREKVKYHMISFISRRYKQTHRDRDWIGGYHSGQGREEGERGD